MAQKFQYDTGRKITNRFIKSLLKIGLEPKIYYLLTVPGRKTGKPHSVPVVLVSEGSQRWLVAPYGEVDWVKNARASGKVELMHRKQNSVFSIRETSLAEAAPVLKNYFQQFPITQPYFDAQENSPNEDFIQDAKTRPVFELIPN